MSKAINGSELKAYSHGLQRLTGGRLRAIFDAVVGKGEVNNASGIPVQLDGALIRDSGDHHYSLLVWIGDQPCAIATIPSHDPAVRDLALQHFGPSPAQIESQRIRESEERKSPGQRLREMYQSWGSQVVDLGKGW